MKVYRIRDENGLYSTGGTNPDFTKGGKTWNNIGHLKNHLRQFFDAGGWKRVQPELYANAEIVEIEIIESEAKKIPVLDTVVEMLEGDVEETKKRFAKFPNSSYHGENIEKTEDYIEKIKRLKDETR